MFFSPLGSAQGDELTNVSTTYRKRVITRFEESTFKLKFFMSETDFDIMRDLFSPMPISYDEVGKLRRHSHPIPAQLQGYAYEKCIEVSKKFKSAIDIGGSPYRTPHHHHLCTLINDSRTQSRYLNAFLDLDGSDAKMHSICRRGAQKCDYLAAYAYMINVYDIPIEEIPYIMERHGVRRLDIWMFLPHNLMCRHYTKDQTFYSNDIVESKSRLCCFRTLKCRFSLKDSANAYVHDYENWAKYYTTVQAKTEKYSYVFEHIETLGTFTNIRVTRGNAKLDPNLSRVISFKPETDAYIVPDVVHYWASSRASSDMFSRYFLVDKTFVDGVLKWATRQADNAYNYANFASNHDAKSISVYYTVEKQQKLVYKGLFVDHTEYERIQISLFMIGAINRLNRTQMVGGMFNFLKNCDDSFWDRFKNALRAHCHNLGLEISAALAGHSKTWYNDHLETRNSRTYFRDLRIKVVPSIVVTGYIDCKGYHHAPTTMWAEDDYAPPSLQADFNPAAPPSAPPMSAPIKKEMHTKMIFDPPGDGNCGIHALQYFVDPKCNKRLVVKPMLDVLGTMQPISKSNHDSNELAAIARDNEMNYICHHDAGIDRFIYDPSWPTAKLRLYMGHFTCVKCDCDNTYVGDYEDLPIVSNATYVNCANEHLSDGAGQALAFRKKFPGYDANIRKPVQPFTFFNHNQCHLALLVAHNLRQDKDRAKAETRLRQLLNGLRAATEPINSTVYLPLAGCGIYGGDLCCFKRLRDEILPNSVLCFFDNNQKEAYARTLACKHGGYIPLASGSPLKMNRGKYDNSSWMLLSPNFNSDKMKLKWADLEKYVIDHGYKRIVELAAAPGFFAECHHKLEYQAYHYQPGDLKLKKGVTAICWKTYAELPQFKDSAIILDYPCPPGDPFYRWSKETLKNGNMVISKFMAYVDESDNYSLEDYINEVFGDCSMTVFRNEGTDAPSSELFYAVTATDDLCDEPVTADISAMLKVVDNYNLDEQRSGVCNCKPPVFKTNANLSWKNDDNQRAASFKKLLDDEYLLKAIDVERLKKLKLPVVSTVGARLGVAGSGKSRDVLEDYCGNCALIISPLKLVSDDHNKHGGNTHDMRSVTYVKAINILLDRGDKYKWLFVDEIFLVDPYMLSVYKALAPSATLYAIGDQNQIIFDHSSLAPKYEIEKTDEYINGSKRCPIAVQDLIRRYIPNFTCISNRQGSLTHSKLSDIVRTPRDILLCATQELKKRLIDSGQPRVNTIHEAMGGTFNTVHIVTSDIDKIKVDRNRYVYTALTRSTNQIVLYGTDEEVEHFYSILGSPIERALDSPVASVVPYADNQIVEEEIMVKNKEPIRTINNETTDLEFIRSVLNKVYPRKNQVVSQYTLDFRINLLIGPESGLQLKIPSQSLEPVDVPISGRTMLGESFLKFFHGKDKFNTMNSITTRYMSKHLPVDRRLFTDVVKAHYDGIDKFLLPKQKRTKLIIGKEQAWKSVQAYLINLQKKFRKNITPEQEKYITTTELAVYNKLADSADFGAIVMDMVDAFMERSDEKMLHLKERFHDLLIEQISSMSAAEQTKFDQLNAEWTSYANNVVDYHMKGQPKEIRELWWDTSDKAGQGISAWGKISNIILSTFQSQFHIWVKDNLDHNVMWAIDKSDADLAQEYIDRGFNQHVSDANYTVYSEDASQFDQSQKSEGTLATCLLALFAGGNEQSIRYYFDKRMQWTGRCLQSFEKHVEYAKFTAQNMMCSGVLMTLTGNTIYIMGEVGGEYKYKEVQFAMFKGDDSVVCCKSRTPRLIDGKRLSEICNYKIKTSVDVVPEFIANFLLPWGWFPDVLRRTSRLAGRIITHPEQWTEIRRSVADCLDVIQTDVTLKLGCEAAAKHYGDKGINITSDEIRSLIVFLKRTTWDDKLTPKVTKEYQILYTDITHMLKQMRGNLNSHYWH